MDGVEADIGSIVGVLWRRGRMVIAAVAGCLAIAAFLIVLLPERFTATTLILVDPARSALIEPAATPASAMAESWRVDSEIEILASDAVLASVIEAKALTADPEFGDGDSLQETLAAVRRALDVRRQAMTYVISLAVTSESPEKAAELSMAIAQAYIDNQSRAKTESVVAAGAVVAGRVAQARWGLEAARADFEALLQAQHGELSATIPSSALTGLMSAQRLAAIDPSGLGEQVVAAQAQQRPDADPAAAAARLAELQQKLAIAQRQYEGLLEQQTALEVEAKHQLADSRIVSPALAPHEPSEPKPASVFLVAGLVGLGLGAGLAFGAETFAGGFTSAQQLRRLTGKPVLAELAFHRTTEGQAHPSDAIMTQPLSRLAEAARRLRIGIDRHFGAGRISRGRVVMVTSSRGGEGKTTAALALGRTYAISGKKTVVIDCDLLAPSVHLGLGLSPEKGLLDYLTKPEDDDGPDVLVVRDEASAMSVIPGARPSDSATDQLFVGPAFERLIAAARERFEIVILDAPPTLDVVDPLYLARHADVIVFTVNFASTPQNEVREALDRIDEVRREDAPAVLVLSRTGERARSRHYYYPRAALSAPPRRRLAKN